MDTPFSDDATDDVENNSTSTHIEPVVWRMDTMAQFDEHVEVPAQPFSVTLRARIESARLVSKEIIGLTPAEAKEYAQSFEGVRVEFSEIGENSSLGVRIYGRVVARVRDGVVVAAGQA